ncbi:MAG: iron ABC transporter permease [Lentisphaerales bacterium]|nr:iron ABC transporter permease [Lentisphaerales bacterium]
MNKKVFIILLSVLAPICIVSMPFFGGSSLSFTEVMAFDAESPDYQIFFNIRLPRVILAFIAGAALSVCGMCFQSMFRNDLATPFTLGIASGASFGVVLYIFLGGPVILSAFLSGTSIAAFSGAMLALLIVFSLVKYKKNVQLGDILLGGVAINFFFSSLILIFQFRAENSQLGEMLYWMIGGLQVIGYEQIRFVIVFVVVGMIVVILNLKEMDLLVIGEDMATSRGVDVAKVRQRLFLAVSLIVGAVVSVCGPIGFVGLMGPHICRKFTGPGHKLLFWASTLFGGVFLMVSDTLARTIFYPTELPVGLITSTLGGPFFFWLIIKGKR